MFSLGLSAPMMFSEFLKLDQNTYSCSSNNTSMSNCAVMIIVSISILLCTSRLRTPSSKLWINLKSMMFSLWKCPILLVSLSYSSCSWDVLLVTASICCDCVSNSLLITSLSPLNIWLDCIVASILLRTAAPTNAAISCEKMIKLPL